MQVNTEKTEIVVFIPPRFTLPTPPSVVYHSTTIKISRSFKYLGLTVHDEAWLSDCAAILASKASAVMWPTISRMRFLGVTRLEARIRIFNTVVAPIAEYGCQVWGVDFLNFSNENKIFDNPLQKLVLNFLRAVTGCRVSVSRWVLLKSCNTLPSQVKIAQLCARVWNNNAGTLSLTGKVLRSDLELMLKGCTDCWTAKFLNAMVSLGLA